MRRDPIDHAARLIASQRRYYDLRAPDYHDPASPSDRRNHGLMAPELARRLLDELDVAGDVLELACGTGAFTGELASRAATLTALDGSPSMLACNREVVGDDRVDYLCADIFDWEPDRRFDLVFFGFWLSHVPPSHDERFWSTVRSCLRPGGRAAFVDEDVRARRHEVAVSAAGTPSARRTLRDGRAFDIVKVFWTAADLERRLRDLGWDAHVRPEGETFLFGTAG